MDYFLISFDNIGRLISSFQVSSLTPEEKESLINQGYIECTAKEWIQFSKKFGGVNNTGYIRDPETGEAKDAPPDLHDKLVLATMLYDKVVTDIKTIENTMNIALINSDTELLTELGLQRTTLLEDYDQALQELRDQVFPTIEELVEGDVEYESSQDA